MNVSCLPYRLTEEERRTFNETGILQIENVLSPEQIAALTRADDRIYAAQLSRGMIRPRLSYS